MWYSDRIKPDTRWAERQEMVTAQIVDRGLTAENVIQAMLEVPRHCFVASDLQAFAYNDRPLPIAGGQTISQPFIVAYMIDALEPKEGERMLEIGAGSGYAAAVLSRLVDKVYTMERLEVLADSADKAWQALRYDNILLRVGDGSRGWPEEAPFDGIIVSAGAPVVPESLLQQLALGGRMVIPVGDRYSQELLRFRKLEDGMVIKEHLTAVRFVPLIGEEGWD
ncbi:MAG: protein-L-isoaspartate(D-aspartate) O-methyltransferase [Candidatus Saccharibacteria bacterium]